MNSKFTIGKLKTRNGNDIQHKMTELLPGDIVGDYKIISLLGSGGMGDVYLVENMQMHKEYALKVLKNEYYNSDAFVSSLKNEARLMAELKHPNIVSVHYMGIDKTRKLLYLVMEYITPVIGERSLVNNNVETIAGCLKAEEVKTNYQLPNTNYYQSLTNLSDLETLLQKKGKLSEEEVLKISKQLCSALSYAHNHKGGKVIHRDIKPANILMDADGNIHISDFGLAKLIEKDNLKDILTTKNPEISIGKMKTRLVVANENRQLITNHQLPITNSSSSIVGTYEYMSPEQQDGLEATTQSDIYSLGLIIYHMLTGQKAKGRFELPSKLGYSKKWDLIIEKCLKPNLIERFKSVAEITVILDSFYKKRSHKYLITFLGIIVLCILGIFVFNYYANPSPDVFEKKVAAHGDALLPSDDVVVHGNALSENNVLDKDYDQTQDHVETSGARLKENAVLDKNVINQNNDVSEELNVNRTGTQMYPENKNVSQSNLGKEEQRTFEQGELDRKLNFTRIEQAANAGNTYAQMRLAGMYYRGEGGFPQDHNEMLKWMTKAAEGGNPVAQNKLGKMYQEGIGVKMPSMYQAVKWYTQASNNGNPEAMVNLGLYYLRERKEPGKAYRLFKQAASKGNKKALRYLNMIPQKDKPKY